MEFSLDFYNSIRKIMARHFGIDLPRDFRGYSTPATKAVLCMEEGENAPVFGAFTAGGLVRLVLGKAKKDFVLRVNEILHDGYLDPYLDFVHTSDLRYLPGEMIYQLLCLVFGEGGFIKGMEKNDSYTHQ